MNYKDIEKILQIKFEDQSLIETAFTHRSYLNEHRSYTNPSNERLEFLGDAVLQLLASEFLYDNYSQSQEGELTSYRAALVRTESLAESAATLGFGEHLLLSQGEDASGGREGPHILANTFESVLGAIYLETDLETCRSFLERTLFPKIEGIIETKTFKDHKSLLQEVTQEKYGQTPTYKVTEEQGPDHSKHFKIGVYLGKEQLGVGEGSSKQRAEQDAATTALEKIEKN